MINYKEKLAPVKAFVFDFDGVMTNGDVWTYGDGEAVRCGNIKDGFAVQYAVKKGYLVAVISGATSKSINNRMHSLGVEQVYTGCGDKIKTYEKFLSDNGLTDEQVLYMGDDLPDYPLLRRAGVATCPADAAVEVKAVADYISLMPGGKGCVRDVIEQVMRLHGTWFHEDAVVW